MFLRNLSRAFIFILVMTSSMIFGVDQEFLHGPDVNKIMKQIFDQHVSQKEITSSLIKKSLTVYIDQFDPQRLYLLEEEVRPFLEVSDVDSIQYMDQYKHQNFSIYQNLNNVIQKSIVRAQKARVSFVSQSPEYLFQQSASSQADGRERWSDPDLKHPFAASEAVLLERERQSLLKFIAAERARYGNQYVANHAKQAVEIFEKEARFHENQYLFLNENGQPMTADEKENAFIMHILKSLANSLDAHTTVLSSSEASEMRMRLEKEVKGIGITVYSSKDGRIFVDTILRGGPAEKSEKVHVDDEILKVDGTVVRGKSVDDVQSLMSGKTGTKIVLVIKQQQGQKEETLTLSCEDIAVDDDRATSAYVDFGKEIIGMIKLDSFYQSDKDVTSENDVRTAIEKLQKKGNLRGLVLDLRENSGGFLSQAVKVVGLFISNGVVVISKYFNGDEHFYRDMDGKTAYDGPLVVLTSKATASAAEIVAQALQDYGVAVIVGDEHTYGKGSIQSQTVTDNQGSAYFKVTVGKYYTVSGKTPQIQGVKADIVVPSQFAHENMGEEYLDYPLQQDTIPAAFDDKLEDISTDLKSWYMKYYTPSLQHRKQLWEKIMPDLKKRSVARISRNTKYQQFIHSTNSQGLSDPQDIDNKDLQMNEAISIVKDMGDLQTQLRLKD